MTRSRNFFTAIYIFFIALTPGAVSETQPAVRRALLWEVASGTGTVYLLGSIHAADESMYPLPETVMSAFRSSSELWVEAKTDGAEGAESQSLMMERALLTEGTLREALGTELHDQLQSETDKAGFPLSAFSSYRPWFVLTQFLMYRLQSLGMRADLGIDRYFIQQAV